MFEFADPLGLCLLPLPVVIRRWLPPATVESSAALKVPFLKRIQRLKLGTQTITQTSHKRFIWLYIAWTLLVIAASGPQWLGNLVMLPQSGRDILLAVDISGSMQLSDMSLSGVSATRLDVVKDVAKRFIDRRVGDRMGLILFGTRAYLQTPLTFDRNTVKALLEDATIGLAGSETAIGDAIGLAVKRLQESYQKSRVLILITDGASNSGILPVQEAARIAQQLGIRIYTIAIGSDTPVMTDLFGQHYPQARPVLDENSLKNIAKTTGGLFFRAKDTEALQRAYQALDQLEPVESDTAAFRSVTPLYPWPLGIAFLISIYIAIKKIIPSILMRQTKRT